jgi:cytochrome c2
MTMFGRMLTEVVALAALAAALEALPARGCPVWTAAALDAFLTSPEEFAPAEERADLMAYLAGDAGRPWPGVRRCA